MDELTGASRAKAEMLMGLGLPEAQAIASAGAVHKPTAKAHMFYMLKIKDDVDDEGMKALKAALKAYSTASKGSVGKCSANYSIADGEVIAVDVHDSPSSMDIHIGNCFPHYIKM